MATTLWKHLIRDDLNYQLHIDYVHVNRVVDWPYSTFHHYVDQGIY